MLTELIKVCYVKRKISDWDAVRARIAIGLVKEHGETLAEVARRVGVSTSAISKIIKRGK